MDDDKREALKSLEEISRVFNEVMDEIEQQSEAYWKSLSKEQQLQVFCAVTRRIYKAELVDKGSYRYALYNVFGFGPESYAPAQMAGYLAIHNSIFDHEHESRLLKAFCVKYNIEDADNKVTEFLI